ncbi:hypothetical protein, partial [Chryseobacterium sp. 8AT]|uniref:hypothetical protein n=1 Tax=Chryseobacterium sp. 8AT TaxID=2653134 RepID=UPI001F23CF18
MKIFFLLSFISIISCNGQTNKDTNMLDLDYLKKNGNVSSISYNGALSIPEAVSLYTSPSPRDTR